jgi:RND superfamily putative drug exporter
LILGVTGGVITSAGVVLAATFATLGVIPIMFLVRSLLVAALAYDIGPRIWWPSKQGRPENDAAARSARGAAEKAETADVGTR